MKHLEIRLKDLIQSESKLNGVRCLSLSSSDLCLNSIAFDGNNGRILLEDSATTSFVTPRRSRRRGREQFLSVTLSDSNESLWQNGEASEVRVCQEVEKAEKGKQHGGGGGALNTTNHLWAGAVTAMVSRAFVAPLERLKLEYIVRGEQKNLLDLIKTIAVTQGIKGFWKGNFVNILRTAPFKAINFYSYEKYRDHLLKITGNEEATNIEMFVAGAAAGITATVLCIPIDTIRTVMVAPGGEALGGLIGTSRHMIQTEGFFSLYKGQEPSIISMAP